MARETKQVDITQESLQNLSDRLFRLSQELPEGEQTLLAAMVLLTAKHLDEAAGEVRVSRDEAKLAGLRGGFNNAFSRFAPDFFARTPNVQRLVPGTVCVE